MTPSLLFRFLAVSAVFVSPLAFAADLASAQEPAHPTIDEPLHKQLKAVYQKDQKCRQTIGDLFMKYGANSPQVHDQAKLIQQADKEDLIVVEEVLDSRGWLGPDVVGWDGSLALFLVIQHSDLAVQEKYLPMMRAAVKAGKARGADLALLEDRVALGEGRLQTYGSQIGFDSKTRTHFVSPLEDPDNVDKRRASVGLGPISDYVKGFGIVWDAQAYKAQLPELQKPR